MFFTTARIHEMPHAKVLNRFPAYVLFIDDDKLWDIQKAVSKYIKGTVLDEWFYLSKNGFATHTSTYGQERNDVYVNIKINDFDKGGYCVTVDYSVYEGVEKDFRAMWSEMKTPLINSFLEAFPNDEKEIRELESLMERKIAEFETYYNFLNVNGKLNKAPKVRMTPFGLRDMGYSTSKVQTNELYTTIPPDIIQKMIEYRAVVLSNDALGLPYERSNLMDLYFTVWVEWENGVLNQDSDRKIKRFPDKTVISGRYRVVFDYNEIRMKKINKNTLDIRVNRFGKTFW